MIQLAQKTMTFLMQFNRLVSEAERKRKMVMLLISYLSWPKAINLREMLSLKKESNKPLASLQTIVEGAVYQLCCSTASITATDTHTNQSLATTTTTATGMGMKSELY